MANKYHTYFGQVITNSELNEIFDSLFAGVDRFIQDFGYAGIVMGGTVAQHSPTNLTVDIDGPTIVYDQNANRMAFASLINVNCHLDENGASTAVVSNLNEKWLSLFIEFVSTPTDPRTDDLGNTVYFKDVATYKINVVQGAEAAIGTPSRPALRADQILIADISLGYGITSIVNAKISSTRSQVAYDLTGSPLAIRAKGFSAVLQSMLDTINSALATISGLDVDAMIADAVSSGSPTSIPSGTVHSVFVALLGAVNAAKNAADAAQTAANSAQTTANTANTTANTATTSITTLDGQAAKKASANTFTATNTFDFNECDDSHPVRKVNKSAHDHPSSSSNKWKLIDRLTLSNGRIVRYFSGEGGNYNWAITVNAGWDPSSGGQNWFKDNGGSEANLVRCVDGELHFYGRTGAGTWLDSEWDDQSRGVLVVGDTIKSNTGFEAGSGDYKANSGKYKFNPARSRTTVLRSAPEVLTPGTGRTWVIDKPAGATLGVVTIHVNVTGDIVATAYKIRRYNHGFGGAGSPTTDINAGTSTSGTGNMDISADFAGITVSDQEDYCISIQPVGTTGLCTILGLQVTWTDPGPDNT